MIRAVRATLKAPPRLGSAAFAAAGACVAAAATVAAGAVVAAALGAAVAGALVAALGAAVGLGCWGALQACSQASEAAPLLRACESLTQLVLKAVKAG